jgi:pyruvate/2-oxoacid:ferredoxin oxidoreductase beta subunit
MTEIIVAAMKHRGCSFVNVLSPCVTFRGKGLYAKSESAKYIDPKHDASNSKPHGTDIGR